jgi:hypothetical protein
VTGWPTGIETIKHLLATHNLQKVSPSPTAASAFPDGAYTLLYDAAQIEYDDISAITAEDVRADAVVV